RVWRIMWTPEGFKLMRASPIIVDYTLHSSLNDNDFLSNLPDECLLTIFSYLDLCRNELY
ncbi:hypothetical protein PFISCL1PPCAC_2163, partial [Pristionchus fissidentatus]